MITEDLKNFPKQFSWEPKIENSDKLVAADNLVVCGMGGSHLAADLIKIALPQLPLTIHSDYGFPVLPKPGLGIISSHSGNTEEALDAFNTAMRQNIPVAVITSGGKLLELAKEHGLPFIQTPDSKIQPRFALGYSLMALLRMTNQNEALMEITRLSNLLNTSSAQNKGQELAQKLHHKIPIIYASTPNTAMALTWKIKFNETAKIPAFYNVWPELNHNEMNGFDTKEKTMPLMEKFHFLFLQDQTDHPQIIKRLDATKRLLEKQEFKVEILPLAGESVFHKIFQSLLVADWTSYYLAEFYGADPEQVPLVEEFKKLIAN